jgi:hypothetical protein
MRSAIMMTLQTPAISSVHLRRRGAAMLLVMIAVGVATTLAVGFLGSHAMATRVSTNAQNLTRARWIAESGLELAGGYVRNNADWRTAKTHGVWINAQSHGGGTLTVSVFDGQDADSDGDIDGDGSLSDDATDPATAVSTGTYNGATCTLRALITSESQSTNQAVMIVPDAASLSAADTARRQILESLGWTVTLLSETASQSALDTAVAQTQAVYVSSTVTSTSMASKLKALSRGVVSEPASLQDDLKIATSAGTSANLTQITPVNVTHYITQGLTADVAATITTSSQPMAYHAGTYASGAVKLAQRPSGGTEGMLSVLDIGASTAESGQTAVHRRVFLPWGGATLDPQSWNDTAKTILTRSLEWAAGLDNDGPASSSRIAVQDFVKIEGSGIIESFSSSSGSTGSAAVVSTNSTGSQKILVTGSGLLKGAAQIGVGGNTSQGIVTQGSGSITGTRTAQTTNYPMPLVSMPDSGISGPYSNVSYGGSGTTTLSSNIHVNNLTVGGSGKLKISGNLTIYCEGSFEVGGSGILEINSGSSLTLYAKGGVRVVNSGQANMNTANPAKFLVYNVSLNNQVEVSGSGQTYAIVVSPNATTTVAGSGRLYGSVLAKSLTVSGSGYLAMDTANAVTITGSSGSSSSSSTSTMTYIP